MYRIFLAQPGAAAHQQLITGLLQQWMLDPCRRLGAEEARDALERLVAATQLRYPVVGDLARSARFRWFDQPMVEAARASVLAGVRDELVYLAEHPDAPDYTEPAGRAGRGAGADRAVPGRAARGRHRRTRADARGAGPSALSRVRAARPDQHVVAGRPMVSCDYTLDERPSHLMTTVAAGCRSCSGLASWSPNCSTSWPRHGRPQSVIDLYLFWPEMPEAPADAAAQLRYALAELGLVQRVRRVAVATCPGGGRPVSYFTFRPVTDDNRLAAPTASSRTIWSVACIRWWAAG